MFRTSWILAAALISLAASVQIVPNPKVPSRPEQAQRDEPKSPRDWFRRADNLTNIRLPGSAPFHMVVRFHAYPGVDFAAPHRSPIQSGDGIYDETWVAPDQWRREITLGNYKATEVRADGSPKFQANSDYEPSRVLMLLSALLNPIPRFILEQELEENHTHWSIERLTAGNLPYIRVSYRHQAKGYGWETRAYDFLPNGILVRSEDDYSGLLTSWQDAVLFDGKLVPRHFTVQGAGLATEMVSGDVAIERVDPQTKISQIPGDPAEPGMTLRPLDFSEVSFSGWKHFESPGAYTTLTAYPPGVSTSITVVFDRHGNPHDPELSAVRAYDRPLNAEQSEQVTTVAMQMVKSAWRDRLSVTIDNSPCEVRSGIMMYPRQSGPH